MSPEIVFALAEWDGARPGVDAWLDGAATVLRYAGPQPESRIDVITVQPLPSRPTSARGGVMATSIGDATHAAATAAMDIAFAATTDHDSLRQTAAQVLSCPEDEVEWAETSLEVDGEDVPARYGLIAELAYAAVAFPRGAYLAIATTMSIRPDELTLVTRVQSTAD